MPNHLLKRRGSAWYTSATQYVEHVFTIRNKRVALALEPPCPLRVPTLGVSVINFRWKKQTTESPSTPGKGIWLGKSKDLNRKSLRDDRINKIDRMVKKTFKVHSVNRVNPVNPVLILGG